MNTQTAIIGDIHGNVRALNGLLRLVEGRRHRLVFVGDYVDRGARSAEVIEVLVQLIHDLPDVVCLAGNHDDAFLRCIEDGALFPFLRMGGASTVRSYIAVPEADTLAHLRRAVPQTHIDFLRALRPDFKADGLLVTHTPELESPDNPEPRFHVYGHVPQRDNVPRIAESSAGIDTGCGLSDTGRLTALLWPSLEVVQVDHAGSRL